MRKEIYIEIDPLSEVALYEQIAEQLKHLILTGSLAEHTPLPSVRGLAQMLDISVITTRRAYTELEAQGYVHTIPAKGTFVSYRYRERIKELGILRLNELLSDSAYLAQALEIDKESYLAQAAALFDLAQKFDYNQPQTRQAISKFIRNR